jgi:hypothetical protein
MTLRDYAVVHYSAAIIGNQTLLAELTLVAERGQLVVDTIAEAASDMADAMLKERTK